MSGFDWPYWRGMAEHGREQWARLGRYAALDICKTGFQALEFSDDDTFLSPALFAAVANPGAAKGFKLVDLINTDGPGGIGFRLEAGGSSFLLVTKPLELLRPFFIDAGGSHAPTADDYLAQDHGATIGQAIEMIGDVCPAYSAVFHRTTRWIVVFRNPDIRSFAAEGAQGTAFLSLPQAATLPFFYEDLLHQCGHVMFSAMAFDRPDLLKVPPDTPLACFTGNRADQRTLYVQFHAIFTEYAIAYGLLNAIESNRFLGNDLAEARGRLAFIMRKYETDLTNLQTVPLAILGPNGRLLARQYEVEFAILFRKAARHIAGIDLSGQPYAFDIGEFARRNRGLGLSSLAASGSDGEQCRRDAS